MRAIQIIAGIVFLTAAVFAGGCSVVFTISLLADGDPYGIWQITALGYLFALGAGMMGWLALRGSQGGEPPDRAGE